MPRETHSRGVRGKRVALWLVALVAITVSLGGVAAGQEDTDPAPEDGAGGEEADPTGSEEAAEEQLLLGSQVYSESCASCHQPSGEGVPGAFPPLAGNPRVDDTDYVRDVTQNGLEGEIEVLGSTYDGLMPAVELSDDEMDAVIAFIQSGFREPTGASEPGTAVPDIGGLPDLATMTYVAAVLIAVGVAVLVLWPRFVSVNDRRTIPWLDASLKAAAVVVWFTVFTVLVPNWVLRTDAVADLDRTAQDIIGAGVWLSGFATGVWGLWYASRHNRI